MENVLNVTIMRTGNFFAGNYIRKNGWILHGRRDNYEPCENTYFILRDENPILRKDSEERKKVEFFASLRKTLKMKLQKKKNVSSVRHVSYPYDINFSIRNILCIGV